MTLLCGDGVGNAARLPLDGVEAKLRGTFSTPTKAYDDVAVHVLFDLADEMRQAGGAPRWVVYLDKTENTVGVLRLCEKSSAATSAWCPGMK